MSTNRRTFTPEFKADAVQLVVQGRRPIAQVARELEVNESSLGYWVTGYRAQHPDPETALPAPEVLRIARLEAANRRLAEQITAIHDASRGVNGFRRVLAELARRGIPVLAENRQVRTEPPRSVFFPMRDAIIRLFDTVFGEQTGERTERHRATPLPGERLRRSPNRPTRSSAGPVRRRRSRRLRGSAKREVCGG